MSLDIVGTDPDLAALLASGDDDEMSGDDDEMSGDDDEMSGDSVAVGVDEIIGAAPLRFRGYLYKMAKKIKRQQARRAAVAKIGRKVALKETAPTRRRLYPIGFGPTLVAPGASSTMTNQPQVIFRPDRLVVPDTLGAFFTIDDFKVGKNSQFVATGSIPASTFSQLGVGVGLGLDTAQISQTLSLLVTNTSGGALTFRATLIGTALE